MVEPIDSNGDNPDATPQRVVLASVGGRDEARVTDWENEGGRFGVEPELADVRSEEVPTVDWPN
jgi:hypothetical protein